MAFSLWFASADRTLRRDQVGDAEVSTVFLGINHQWKDGEPPVLFETMIFGGPRDGYQNRYSTWEEAEQGHLSALAIVGGLEPDVRYDGFEKFAPPDPSTRTRLERLSEDE